MSLKMVPSYVDLLLLFLMVNHGFAPPAAAAVNASIGSKFHQDLGTIKDVTDVTVPLVNVIQSGSRSITTTITTTTKWTVQAESGSALPARNNNILQDTFYSIIASPAEYLSYITSWLTSRIKFSTRRPAQGTQDQARYSMHSFRHVPQDKQQSLTLREQQEQHVEPLVDTTTEILASYLVTLVASRHSPQRQPNSLVVRQQLRNYVSRIAALYRGNQNAFHNFEHATHVTLAANQLLSSLLNMKVENGGKDHPPVRIPLHIQALQADPLLSFAIVFSTMIHDVDHSGMTNAQLIREDSLLARRYNNQSVAEQNSIHVALTLLDNDPNFDALRAAIYGSRANKDRFHKLVRLLVLATDIADTTLRQDRQQRWDRAFGANHGTDSAAASTSTTDEKLILLVEHLMQVADVSHTMVQDFATYRYWNERLFRELRQAFVTGRTIDTSAASSSSTTSISHKDPASGWFQGELGFYDYYVIPLARRWSQYCSGGTVSSIKNGSATNDACHLVTRARNHRKQWERQGQEIVADMLLNNDLLIAATNGVKDSPLSTLLAG